MKNKLIVRVVIGLVLIVVLGLAGVGLMALVRGGPRGQPVSQTPSIAPSAAMDAPQAVTAAAPADQRQVVINGRALTAQQLQEFQTLYRVQPLPGNYWYDAQSGLYGVVGSGAAGFMYPGHELGPLAADASGGDTGVFINGRNQTAREVQILSALARTQVQSGRYWLDAQGNAGYEGNPIPVGNLFAAALAAQQGGGASGGAAGDGDNFWNTRFSAGNYNADNSAGYVSLPGGGTVSYGY